MKSKATSEEAVPKPKDEDTEKLQGVLSPNKDEPSVGKPCKPSRRRPCMSGIAEPTEAEASQTSKRRRRTAAEAWAEGR